MALILNNAKHRLLVGGGASNIAAIGPSAHKENRLDKSGVRVAAVLSDTPQAKGPALSRSVGC